MTQSDPRLVLNIKEKDNQTATKRIDDKQNWQPFPKKVATLLPKLTWIYLNSAVAGVVSCGGHKRKSLPRTSS